MDRAAVRARAPGEDFAVTIRCFLGYSHGRSYRRGHSGASMNKILATLLIGLMLAVGGALPLLDPMRMVLLPMGVVTMRLPYACSDRLPTRVALKHNTKSG
jgi:hypothetical protein